MSTTTSRGKSFDIATLVGVFQDIEWGRTLRLGSGIVLMAFVLLHLVNHALGIIGLDAMDVMQTWRWAVWRNPVGTTLLYGSFAVHIILTLSRIVSRGTFRMPAKEAVQLVLGLSIPFLLVGHVTGTRLIGEVYGVNEFYDAVLRHLWPGSAILQTILVIVVWTHGVIGLHYILRAYRPKSGWIDHLLAAIAILVPVLALAGFVVASRESHARGPEDVIDPRAIVLQDRAVAIGRYGSLALLLLVGGAMTAREINRRRRRNFSVQFMGHGAVTVKPGPTLLEISRDHGIPHPSICGGRGRCATCRVLVTKGLEELPDMGIAERILLEQISAPAGVRLACQIRPSQDLLVQILLPVVGDKVNLTQTEHTGWGLAEMATVLVVDLRAFTGLVNTQVPYELVVLINRFQEEMNQAVLAHGGRVDMMIVDGLTAIFSRNGHGDHGCRDALKAARDMFRSVDALNEQFQGALPLPLRIGIGIHTGSTLTARIHGGQGATIMMALGEVVTVASRLEIASKDMLGDLVMSKEAAQAAGLTIMSSRCRDIYVSGRDKPVSAYPINDLKEIEGLS